MLQICGDVASSVHFVGPHCILSAYWHLPTLDLTVYNALVSKSAFSAHRSMTVA